MNDISAITCAGCSHEIEARRGPIAAEDFADPDGISPRCGQALVRHRRTSRPGSALRLADFSRCRLGGRISRASSICRNASPARITSSATVPREDARSRTARPRSPSPWHRHCRRSCGLLSDVSKGLPAPNRTNSLRQAALRRVEVEGWREPGLSPLEAKAPTRGQPQPRLLSPFDPLIWFRPRAERLFDFHYRIEIYTPESQRKWGYYVLPFLLTTALLPASTSKRIAPTARCWFAQPIWNPGPIRGRHPALHGELHAWADWLDLAITVVDRARRLSAPCSATNAVNMQAC